jgi:zyxin
VRKDKEVWCSNCYSSEMTCDMCNKPLPTTYVATKGRNFLENSLTIFSGKKYHSDCFTCGNCSKALGTNYYDVEGVFQCENCYQNTIGRCGTCGNALDGQFVKCLDKKYHEKCFVCSGCRTPLEEDFYNVGGNPSCYNCATKA